MNIVIIQPSTRKLKKFDAIVNGTKTVSFGQRGASDFTIHKDELRKQRYISRHSGMGEDWDDPLTSGFYAENVLWNLPTLQESIDDMNKRFRPKGYLFILRNKKPEPYKN